MSGAGKKSASKALSLYRLTLEEAVGPRRPSPKAGGSRHAKDEAEKPRSKRRGMTK
jgi:hypothetical protein